MERVEKLEDHPVVRAWNKLDTNHIVIQTIEVLKRGRKIEVLLLQGIDGSTPVRIIAKGAQYENIKIEDFLYREVLAKCHFASPRYYGFVRNYGDNFSWLFIDEAIGPFYDNENINHNRAALEWLAALHTTKLSSSQISILPDRDLDCYYQYLLFIDQNIRTNRGNKELRNENHRMLNNVTSSLDEIESIWEEIKSINTILPLTFVHGDLKAKNVRLLKSGSKTTLIVFDWEMAGWGTSSIDFGEMIFQMPPKQLAYYLELIDIPYSLFSLRDFTRFIQSGRLLRLITSIYWESRRLRFPWLTRPLRRIEYYRFGISEILSKWEKPSL